MNRKTSIQEDKLYFYLRLQYTYSVGFDIGIDLMITYTVKITTELAEEVYTYTGLSADTVKEMLVDWMDESIQSISVERE